MKIFISVRYQFLLFIPFPALFIIMLSALWREVEELILYLNETSKNVKQ